MSVCPKGHFPDPTKQFVELRIARQIGTQCQGVNEQADQTFGFDPVATGRGRAHYDIVLTTVTRQ